MVYLSAKMIFEFMTNCFHFLLQNYGDEIYTIQAVVQEIRDKQTRSRLQILPYSLNFREPTPQSISHGISRSSP